MKRHRLESRDLNKNFSCVLVAGSLGWGEDPSAGSEPAWKEIWGKGDRKERELC